ncbi:hypothetical protein [Streptomyces rimosus]|uniref:hypothetical protein n=1 Tax=Streptomyces rimosus TaxID=1927 RepID=UPI000A42A851|nr:hypothetical protein [Streptomyces rimosus]
MDNATLHLEGARPVLRFERVLPRPPEAVWRALTDGGGGRRGGGRAFEPVLGPQEGPPAGVGQER